MSPWTNPLDYGIGQATCVQRFDERILDNIDFAGSHKHSGAAGDGSQMASSSLRGSNANQSVYQYVTLFPFLPVSITSGNANNASANTVGGGRHTIKNTKGASSNYNVDLHSGTWLVSAYYRSTPQGGIMSVCLNGTLIGAIDTYSSGSTSDNLSATSSFTLSSSGQFSLKLETTASNVSSTAYFCEPQLLSFFRTSA